MSAKETLLNTLLIAQNCIELPSLTDGPPAEIKRNNQASMLRQGLAVLIFSTVETFIRERTAELLNSFDNTKLKFADLLPGLQDAVTIEAVNGIRFRMKMQDQANKAAWLVGELAPIVTTAATLSKVSQYSFAHSKSNIDETDIQEILKCFGIDSGWTQITNISSRVGIAIIDCRADFIAMKKRRHASAHALTSKITSSEIESSLNSAMAICLGFDLLLTQSTLLHNLGRHKVPKQDTNPAMTHSDVKIAYIKPKGTEFIVHAEDPAPPSKKSKRIKYKNSIDAWNFAKTDMVALGTQVIEQHNDGKPKDWVLGL